VAALTEVAAICAKRSDGEALSDLTFRAMASRAGLYPADVVLTTLKTWPDKSKWFPTWHELKTELDRLNAYRAHCRSIIETARNHQNREKAA
jgi:N-acyl-D-aspartate/D-glutamate deacylase